MMTLLGEASNLKKLYLFLSLFGLCFLGACQQEKPAQPASKEPTQEKATTPEKEKMTAQYMIDPETYLVRPIGDANPKVVLLTFDDVPRPLPESNAPKIAEALAAEDVHAMFFVNGMYLDEERGQKIVRDLAKAGHMIGNHTEGHADVTNLTEEELRWQIETTDDKIKEAGGGETRFFRPPFGSSSEVMYQLMDEKKMQPMNWTYGYDWEAEYEDPEALADIMVNTPYLQPGANLLMHDTQWTAQALPAIIAGLKAKGYTIVNPWEIANVDELAAWQEKNQAAAQ